MRINVRSGSFTHTGAGITFGAGGGAATTTTPKWWRGFNATPGDRESDPTLAGPAINLGTNGVTVSSPFQRFTGLAFSAARSSATLLTISSNSLAFDRCQFTNTGSGNVVNLAAFASNNAGFARCRFSLSDTATDVLLLNDVAILFGCTIRGGRDGAVLGATIPVIGCTFDGQARDAISQTSNATPASVVLVNNTFYNCGGAAYKTIVIPTVTLLAADNLFANVGTYGINNASGTNTSKFQLLGNDFYSLTSGFYAGLTECTSPGGSLSFGERTESASPFTNAGAHDLSIVTTAQAKGGGQPGLFEGESYTSYPDCGAVQRQEAGGTTNTYIINRTINMYLNEGWEV